MRVSGPHTDAIDRSILLLAVVAVGLMVISTIRNEALMAVHAGDVVLAAGAADPMLPPSGLAAAAAASMRQRGEEVVNRAYLGCKPTVT